MGTYWVMYPWWARLLKRLARWAEGRAESGAVYADATGRRVRRRR